MKIAMTVSNNVADDVRVIKEAKALSDNGYEVYIFGNSRNGERLCIGDIKIINSKYPLLKNILLFIKSFRKKDNYTKINTNINFEKSIKHKIKDFIKGIVIIIIIESIQKKIYKDIKRTGIIFDYIHCHDLDTLMVGVKIKREINSKLIYDSHELWTEMSGINVYVKCKYTKIERKIITSVDQLITVSPSIIKELKQRYKLTIEPKLIRNIPSYNIINDVKMPNPQKIKLLYIGYYIKGRGIENLVEAAIDFPENTELTLIIQNSENVVKELKNKINELKLSDKVKINVFVPQDRIIQEISKYDIGILPYLPVSLNNLFCLPNKLFQYLSAGLCVISNDLPDVKEIIMRYQCGLIYDDISSLANIITKLSLSPYKIFNFKRNALKSIYYELNWDQEKNNLLDLYSNDLK